LAITELLHRPKRRRGREGEKEESGRGKRMKRTLKRVLREAERGTPLLAD